MDNSRGERLKTMLEMLKMTQLEFGETCDINPAYINQMITGTRPVSEKTALRIKEHYQKMNLQWLLYGDGDMFMNEEQEVRETEPEYVQEPAGLFRGAEQVINDLRKKISDIERRLEALEQEPNSD